MIDNCLFNDNLNIKYIRFFKLFYINEWGLPHKRNIL